MISIIVFIYFFGVSMWQLLQFCLCHRGNLETCVFLMCVIVAYPCVIGAIPLATMTQKSAFGFSNMFPEVMVEWF